MQSFVRGTSQNQLYDLGLSPNLFDPLMQSDNSIESPQNQNYYHIRSNRTQIDYFQKVLE